MSTEVAISSAYREQMQQLVSSSRDQHVPIAIFEEESKLADLRGHFPDLQDYFLVRTIPGDPTPATKRVKETGRDEMEEDYENYPYAREKAFTNLTAALKAAQVTDVEIAGRYLSITTLDERGVTPHEAKQFAEEAQHAEGMKEWIDRKMVPGACVGIVMREVLKAGINVNVSEAVGPHKPSLFFDRHEQSVLPVGEVT
jgi:hypothetical protein